jgi:ABC-type branched-subunit amino acid transport system ATPase component
MNVELRHIHKHFGKVHANDDIVLDIPAGTIQGILGENGAGKSTLMKVLSGFIQADSGEILLEGKPVSEEEFEQLNEEQKEKIKANLRAMQDLAMAEARKVQYLEREAKEKVRDLDSSVALFAVGHLIDEVLEKYQDNASVTEYLEAVKLDVVKNIKDFKQSSSSEEQGQMAMFGKTTKEIVEERHAVNLLVDNRNSEGVRWRRTGTSGCTIYMNPILFSLPAGLRHAGRQPSLLRH